jgi:hypothetical protein
MDLFSTEPDKNINLLPKDGTVNYYGSLIAKAYLYLAELLENIDWKMTKLSFWQTHHHQRKVAWYGDMNFNYTYSNTTNKPCLGLQLYELKSLVEDKTAKPTIPAC